MTRLPLLAVRLATAPEANSIPVGKDKAEAEDGASEEDMADEPSFTEITLDVKH